MKPALIVLLLIFILPHVIWSLYYILYYIGRLIRGGYKLASTVELPRPDQVRFRRRLLYFIASVYVVASVSAALWLSYELTSDLFPSARFAIANAVWIIAWVVGFIVWLTIRYRRLVKEFPPPDTNFSARTLIQWNERQKWRSMITTKLIGAEKHFGRHLLVFFAVLISFALLTVGFVWFTTSLLY